MLWLLTLVVAPIVSRILAMAVSRKREYLADATGAQFTRNPLALASALEKLEAAASPTRAITRGAAHLCIVDPAPGLFSSREGFLADALASHPPIGQRIIPAAGHGVSARRAGCALGAPQRSRRSAHQIDHVRGEAPRIEGQLDARGPRPRSAGRRPRPRRARPRDTPDRPADRIRRAACAPAAPRAAEHHHQGHADAPGAPSRRSASWHTLHREAGAAEQQRHDASQPSSGT